MKTPKISIIVPVYNAERCLHRCIDSILAQTFRDFELLLIDDGSKDNSGYICDEYAEKDERVKVWHKENGGVSSARNVGLDNARGEWVTFADSDDWLEPNAFAYYDEMTNKHAFDYLYCGYFLNGVEVKLEKEESLDMPNFIERYECDKLWFGVYSKNIIKSNQIRFNEKISLAEDKLFNCQFFKSCQKVYVTKLCFYHYHFGNTQSLSFKGFDIDNFLFCHILVYQELSQINHPKANSEFTHAFKGIIWQSICQKRTIKQLMSMFCFVNEEITLQNVLLLKSKLFFYIYCYCQILKFKIKGK